MTRLAALFVVALSACATGAETIEVSLGDDVRTGRADDILGKKFSWTIDDERFNWYRDRDPSTVPEHAVTVRYRAADKLVLNGRVVYFDPWGPKTGDPPNFTFTDILDVNVTSIGREGVQLGFVMFDYSDYWVTGNVRPYVCPYMGARTGLYTSVAFDFARSEVTIDGTETAKLADCGIDLTAAVATDAGRWSLGTLVLPLSDTVNFGGTYRYAFDVAVR